MKRKRFEMAKNVVVCLNMIFILVFFLSGAAWAQAPFWGKYRGTVTDVSDPLSLGRIKAEVPDVLGSGSSTGWALPAFPFAAPSHGLILIPEIGDHVWIEFEHGNPAFPVWTGAFSETNLPALGLGTTRILVTSKGHRILIDDASNTLEFVNALGPEITMTDQEITLQVGNTSLTITADGVYINKKLFKTR